MDVGKKSNTFFTITFPTPYKAFFTVVTARNIISSTLNDTFDKQHQQDSIPRGSFQESLVVEKSVEAAVCVLGGIMTIPWGILRCHAMVINMVWKHVYVVLYHNAHTVLKP